MINIEYNSDGIKVTVGEVSKIFNDNQLPLKVSIKKYVSGETIWSTNVTDFMWVAFPQTEMKNVVIHDSQGNLIKEYKWSVFDHGSIHYKSLWLYCRGLINRGKKPKGIAIGTHDGEFGEWVPVADHFFSDIVLVEASQKQFDKLSQNYTNRKDLKLIKELISIDGDEVEFFEGGEGYTNSIVERVIRSWETEEITKSLKKSKSFNSLIEDQGGKVDWIHLDVEGLDVQLLVSLKKEYIPDFIIFEDYNLSEEDRISIGDWIKQNNFKSHSEGGICMLNR
jgi:hypothetical protein